MALLVERDAKLSNQPKHISFMQAELERLSAGIYRAEGMIRYLSERYANTMRKRIFRRLRYALKLAFKRYSIRPPRYSVRTSRYNVVRSSIFFDKNFYLGSNADVRALAFDPAVHYLLFGSKEGRDPGPQFSETGYRALYPDVDASPLSALEHYESYGRKEGRRLLSAGPQLDLPRGEEASMPATTTPGPVAAQAQRKPVRFADTGAWRESIGRSGLFEPDVYLSLNQDLRAGGVDPWVHFLNHGVWEGRQFTTTELVARALSRLAPEIGEELCVVRESLSSHTDEETIIEAAEPLASSGVKIGVYCNSRGNFFLQEIANLVNWQLSVLGINSQLRTEESELTEEFDIRIFIAPHEFYILGRGGEWRSLADAPGTVLFNTEQAQTTWFNLAVPHLLRAPLVLDLNFQTALLTRKLGCSSIYFAPQYLDNCAYTTASLDVSCIELVRGYEFSRRRFDWT